MTLLQYEFMLVAREQVVFQEFLEIQDLRVRKVIEEWMDQEVYREQEVTL